MKELFLVFGFLLVSAILGFAASADFLEINSGVGEPPIYQQAVEESDIDGSYSYDETISILSSIGFGLEQEEVENAVSKMSPDLVDTLVEYTVNLIGSEDFPDELKSIRLVVECRSEGDADNLIRGVGRLILWELHNGLDGIRCPYNRDLLLDSFESVITGLRGVFNVIDILNRDAAVYARLYDQL
jgi:hypothetical protein